MTTRLCWHNLTHATTTCCVGIAGDEPLMPKVCMIRHTVGGVGGACTVTPVSRFAALSSAVLSFHDRSHELLFSMLTVIKLLTAYYTFIKDLIILFSAKMNSHCLYFHQSNANYLFFFFCGLHASSMTTTSLHGCIINLRPHCFFCPLF